MFLKFKKIYSFRDIKIFEINKFKTTHFLFFNMEKRGLMLIVSFILISCSLTFVSSKDYSEDYSDYTYEMCSKLEGDFIDCMLDVAININDLNVCENELIVPKGKENQIKTLQDKEVCYKSLALRTGDYSFCYNLDSFIGHCIMGVAKETDNPNLCEKAEGYEEDCYFYLVKKTSDVELCENIGTTGPRGKEDCYWKVAVISGQSEHCDKITESYLKDRCFFESPLSFKTSFGKVVLLRLAILAILISLFSLLFYLKKSKVVLFSIMGAIIFLGIFLLGHVLQDPSHLRTFLIGPLFLIVFLFKTNLVNLGYNANSWISFIYTLGAGAFLGFMIGARLSKKIKIVIISIYSLICLVASWISFILGSIM